MLHDIEFFESKLGKMDGCDGTVEHLTTIVKSKQVKQIEYTADSAETRDDSEDEEL